MDEEMESKGCRVEEMKSRRDGESEEKEVTLEDAKVLDPNRRCTNIRNGKVANNRPWQH